MAERLQVRLLGTGTAFNADGRASQAIVVEPPGTAPFLVDVGQDSMTAMIRQQVDPAALDRVFITHHHGDHIAGWPFLMLQLNFEHGRDRPLEVYGPTGTRDCLDGLMRICYPDIIPKLTFDTVFHEHPVTAADGLTGGADIRFDVVPVDHIASSVGYRFHVSERTLGVSGDTRWCEGLERLAEGCDTLVLECTFLETLPLSHISLEEIRTGRDRLGAEQIVLTHLPDRVAAELSRDPIPGVLAGHDGLQFGV